NPTFLPSVLPSWHDAPPHVDAAGRLAGHLKSTRASAKHTRKLCQDRLALAVKERAAYWKQRGKQRAVREGDANTQFFHAHATQRLRRNHIRGIEVDGALITSHHGKVAALTTHFKNIMGTPGSCRWGFDLHDIYAGRPKATAALTVDFTQTEALLAVRGMNANSAPG
ncbi:unnamed protein product, partial [Urochloa humidicola]